jgi:hypothetical protein
MIHPLQHVYHHVSYTLYIGGRQAEINAVMKYAARRQALGLDHRDNVYAPVHCDDPITYCPLSELYPSFSSSSPLRTHDENGRPVYIQPDHVSAITPEQFRARYLHRGIPVVITDAGNDWSIRTWNLSTFATHMGEQVVIPRSAKKQRGVRGVYLWEAWHTYTIQGIWRSRQRNESDSLYYSW